MSDEPKNVVYRYKVPEEPGEFELELPYGARLIHFDTKTGRPEDLNVWALVNPTAPLGPRKFVLAFTGQGLPGPECTYGHVGTCMTYSTHPFTLETNVFLWHLFERAT